jgi:hypothetical protein
LDNLVRRTGIDDRLASAPPGVTLLLDCRFVISLLKQRSNYVGLVMSAFALFTNSPRLPEG